VAEARDWSLPFFLVTLTAGDADGDGGGCQSLCEREWRLTAAVAVPVVLLLLSV
jgi:hypothetical protein